MTQKTTSDGAKPVYKRSGPKWATPYAAYLELFLPKQGSGEYSKTPIDIEISMGDQEFTESDGFGFRLSFKRVFLTIIPRKCEVSREGRLERSIPKEEFTYLIKKIVNSSTDGELSAEGGLSNTARHLLSTIGIDIGASGKINKKSKWDDSTELQSRGEYRLVRWISAGRWEVGNEKLGDPREENGRLRGAYINPDAESEGGRPLCFVNALENENYDVNIELSAKKKDLIYEPLGPVLNDEVWKKENRNNIEKLLLGKMLEKMNRSDGLEPAEGEVILARAKLTVLREMGDD